MKKTPTVEAEDELPQIDEDTVGTFSEEVLRAMMSQV